MSLSFPYQNSFLDSLKRKGLSKRTVLQYQLTLTDFFKYEANFNTAFATSYDLQDVVENDVHHYLSMLAEQRQYSKTTQNKHLSNLRGYFKYLLKHHLITTLPTLPFQIPTIVAQPKNTAWPAMLDELLTNHGLHVYTRAMLLFTSKGFTALEILKPDFYQTAYRLNLRGAELAVFNELLTVAKPLQLKTGSKDLFLKTRRNQDKAHLTIFALHKYLHSDGAKIGIPLKPRMLRQEYILWYMDHHRNDDITGVVEYLRLDLNSFRYYQNLQRHHDIQAAEERQNA